MKQHNCFSLQLETCEAKVRLVVMDCILLESYIKAGDNIAAGIQEKRIEVVLKELDCDQLSEVLYFYEKTTNQTENPL